MEIPLILVLALVLNLTLGEPPNFIHPVALMGKVISFLLKGSGKFSNKIQFIYGIVVVL